MEVSLLLYNVIPYFFDFIVYLWLIQDAEKSPIMILKKYYILILHIIIPTLKLNQNHEILIKVYKTITVLCHA